MKSLPGPERLRARQCVTSHAEPEDRAAQLLRAIPDPTPMSTATLRRIKLRALGRASHRSRRIAPWAFVVAAFLGISGAAYAASRAWSADAAPQTELLEPPALPAPASSAVNRAASSDATTELRESQLLGLALTKLRRDRDARAALGALDEYAQRFPNGHLVPEAQRTRAEALLLLDRRAEARSVLDAMSGAALGREMRVRRAELRAEVGRCREAIPDFSSALSPEPQDSLDERALFGRARCRQGLEPAAARRDFELYASRFTNGHFAH